jgi:hypothetical protein
MMSLLALHRIAAQRGDGLRPELVSLLERLGCSESDRTSLAQVQSGDRSTAPSPPDLTHTIPTRCVRVSGALPTNRK